MKIGDRTQNLEDVRGEISLRAQVLQAFLGMIPSGGLAETEIPQQLERMYWLLRRERELMGSEWETVRDPLLHSGSNS
jgi:hypothetical protein